MVSGPVGAWRANRNKWLSRFRCDADPKVTHCHHLQKVDSIVASSAVSQAFRWLELLKCRLLVLSWVHGGNDSNASHQGWMNELTWLRMIKPVQNEFSIKSTSSPDVAALGSAASATSPWQNTPPSWIYQLETEPQQSWQRKAFHGISGVPSSQHNNVQTLIRRDPHWLWIMVEWW